MGIRTASAGALDAAIGTLMTTLDAYLLLRAQAGEPPDYAEKAFWTVLIRHLRDRVPVRTLIDNSRFRPRPIPIETAKTVVANDHLA
jgi:hypothetical protein